MPGLLSVLRSSIVGSSLIESHPLRMHALAGLYNWVEVAQASVLPCLDLDLTAPSTIAGLQGLPLDKYGRLLSLARERHQQFRQNLDNPAIFRGSALDFRCLTCGNGVRDDKWKILRMRLVDEFSACTSGMQIERNVAAWPEWHEAMQAYHCRDVTLYTPLSTYQQLIIVLRGLPTQLDVS